MLAQLGFEVAPALIVSQLLGKLRIALRKILLLDALHSDVVAHRLPREALLAKVRRIVHLELQLLSGLRSTQRIVEGSQRVLGANLDQNVLDSDRRAGGYIFKAVLGHGLREILPRAAKLDLSPVAIDEGTIFLHRLDRRMAIQNAVQFGTELFVGQRRIRLRNMNAVVTRDVDHRGNLKR